jgi:hypothetical protein
MWLECEDLVDYTGDSPVAEWPVALAGVFGAGPPFTASCIAQEPARKWETHRAAGHEIAITADAVTQANVAQAYSQMPA